MNNFDPQKLTIGELFQKNTSLTIPRFQRSYEWKSVNIEDFYNDFVKVSDDSLNFLGNIVIDRSDDSKRQIIDGQQRIITTTILFAAIRDYLREDLKTDDAKQLATEIDSSFIKHGTFAQTDSLYRLSPAADLKDFFTSYIQIGGVESRKATKPLTPSAKNTVIAYKKFRQLITENAGSTQQYEIWKQKILKITGISLIVIDIFNQDMAFAIFESFNAKRVDLSVADLVKNYYFSSLGKNDQLNEKTMDRWDDVVATLSSITQVDRFLHQYIQSYDGRFPRSQLYRRIRARIQLDPQKFIKEIETNTQVLRSLKAGEVENVPGMNLGKREADQINASLESLAGFNVEQCYILLLAVFRNSERFTPKFLIRVVEAIENFTFSYSKIANGQANVLEDIYSRFARDLEESEVQGPIEVSSGKFYSSLHKDLNELMPSEDNFVSKFIELDYSNNSQKRLIKYIFSKVEERNTRGGSALGYAANIDHIFPQNPRGVKRPSLYNKIGNLVPIDLTTNSKIGNQLPSEKIPIYEGITNITQIKALLEFFSLNGSEVNDDLITKRGKELAQLAHALWQLKK